MSEELKPCPFCDGSAEYDNDDNGYVWLQCRNCGVSTDTATHGNTDARVKLADMWNHRPTPPAAQVQGERPVIVGTLMIGEQGWDNAVELSPGPVMALAEKCPTSSMPLMTVAQHERIVAALQAEVSRLKVMADNYFVIATDRHLEIERLKAALSAPPAAGVPEGWKLVPLEPTCKMTHIGQAMRYHAPNSIGHIYRTMLAASPTPPASEQQQAVVMPDDAFKAEFMTWWEDHGQYCRAGGGNYERSFAFEAWRHLYPRLIQASLNPHLAGVNQGVTTEAGNGGDA